MSTRPELTDDAGHHRYVARVDGVQAGLIAYVLGPGGIRLVHTEVADAYEGRGIAGALARYALDDARTRGLSVHPDCPFVKAWIDRHPDYADLVA